MNIGTRRAGLEVISADLADGMLSRQRPGLAALCSGPFILEPEDSLTPARNLAADDFHVIENALTVVADDPDLMSEVDTAIGSAAGPLTGTPEAPTITTEAANEIADLDALWPHEWNVADARGFEPQRIEAPMLPVQTAIALFLRRAADMLIAVVALVIFTPLMILLALAIRVLSSGGALFKQQRVGRDGEFFDVLKFRSMTAGAHDQVLRDDGLRKQYQDNDFKLPENDPRITGLGKVMRKTSLDELPQLINVIKGDMSIVGIRPLLPDELAMRPVYDQRLYKMMRPGLTGLWQVEGRSNVTKDERVALDRTYVERWSVSRDMRIMVRTPVALLRTNATC